MLWLRAMCKLPSAPRAVQDDVAFADLGLVVVDEQHRFGVQQHGVVEQG